MNDTDQLDFFMKHEILNKNDPNTLVCMVCHEVKLIKDFEPSKSGYKGVRRTCTMCRSKDRRLRNQHRREHNYPDENYVCPICGGTKDNDQIKYDNKTDGWVIDHCHKTGKFRAWLCLTCNSGMGHLKDNSKIVRKAAEYLEYHNKILGVTEEKIENEGS